MLNDKKLSVIVRIYNVEEYISQCIESIINQTYKNLEIILVDDGSTDLSGSICDQYAEMDKRIKVLHQENKGAVKAAYKGVCAASCEYVTFVDGDDWIAKNTYESVLNELEEEIDLITYGAIRYTDEYVYRYTPNRIPEGIYSKKDIEEKIFPRMLWNVEKKQKFDLDPALWNKVVKREIILESVENIKNLQIHYCEDAAIVYPMMKAVDKMIVLKECYYYHRQRKNDKIPPYIVDSLFFSKLLQLYEYLKTNLNFHSSFELQIDYFYMESVLLKKRVYGERMDSDKFLFPFDKVPYASKIILYGAGMVGQTYQSQVERIRYCEIVAWVDRNYKSYLSKNVCEIETIKEVKYDYLVIANIDKESALSIKKDLIKMGVEENKIII